MPSYRRTRTDRGIGVGNDAFLPDHGLPLYATRGPGTLVMRMLKVMQSPQIMHDQAQTHIGVAGFPTGNMNLSGLSTDEEQNAYLASLANGEG